MLFGPILRLPMSLIFALIFFILNYIPHIVCFLFHFGIKQGPIIAVCIPIPLIIFRPNFSFLEVVLAILLPTVASLLFSLISAHESHPPRHRRAQGSRRFAPSSPRFSLSPFFSL